MTQNGRVALLLAMLLAPIAAPVAAATTPAAAAASDAVTLPFNPPIGTPLRYDFEMKSEADGKLRQRVRTRDELTYSRAEGGGYLLRWSSGALQVEAPGPMQKVLEKTYAAAMGTPMLIAVSSEGVPERVINAAELRVLTEKALVTLVQSFDSEFAGIPAETRTALNKMLTAILDQQRQQSPEVFAESLMEGPLLMLPAPGPLVPGQAQSAEVEQPSPLGNGNIRFLAQVELRNYQPGVSAEIRASSAANPEDAKRAMAAFVTTLLAAIENPVQRQEAEASVAKMGPMAISDEAVITVALPAGLTETMRYQKQVTVPGQPVRLDTRNYTRAR
jgi:hypothetical protein